MRASQSVDGERVTVAAARLAAEVMAQFTPNDQREEAFEHIHLHGFIDAYEKAREAGLDPHAFVEAMLVESPQEKTLSDARAIIDKAYAAKQAKQ
jgi:hypothetical protein